MERILGLDVGDKYIGVAISDILGVTAQGLTTIKRESNVKTFEAIEKMINEHNINKIVVGLPKNMNGSIGPQGEKVQKFANKLKNKFKIDIIYIDERLTTVAAENLLIEANVSREKRKQVIDKVAASYILQTYLDGRS